MLSIRIRNTAIPDTIDVPVIITVRKKHIIGDFEVFFEVSRLFCLPNCPERGKLGCPLWSPRIFKLQELIQKKRKTFICNFLQFLVIKPMYPESEPDPESLELMDRYWSKSGFSDSWSATLVLLNDLLPHVPYHFFFLTSYLFYV
jgi:hypothetical protein